MNRGGRRDGDSGAKWDDGRDYQSGRDRSRYGYTDMGDRGQHYGRPRTQNPVCALIFFRRVYFRKKSVFFSIVEFLNHQC